MSTPEEQPHELPLSSSEEAAPAAAPAARAPAETAETAYETEGEREGEEVAPPSGEPESPPPAPTVEVVAPAPVPAPAPAPAPSSVAAAAAPAPKGTGKKGTGKKGTDKKDAGGDGEGDRPFDPALDLPAYREGMDWFVLRVASNKESYVRDTLLRKVQIEGLESRVGRIMVPTEKTKTLKGGKTKITETKLYPGYVFVEMKLEDDGRIPQDVFFLIKETTGVGDFVGTAGRPTPMSVHEVEKMLFDSRQPEEMPEVKMEFQPGDSVTISEGPFENYEGTVDEVLPDKGLVRVLVTIFGRQAPIELEYWQIVKVNE